MLCLGVLPHLNPVEATLGPLSRSHAVLSHFSCAGGPAHCQTQAGAIHCSAPTSCSALPAPSSLSHLAVCCSPVAMWRPYTTADRSLGTCFVELLLACMLVLACLATPCLRSMSQRRPGQPGAQLQVSCRISQIMDSGPWIATQHTAVVGTRCAAMWCSGPRPACIAVHVRKTVGEPGHLEHGTDLSRPRAAS